jgi:hypothetical protein
MWKLVYAEILMKFGWKSISSVAYWADSQIVTFAISFEPNCERGILLSSLIVALAVTFKPGFE